MHLVHTDLNRSGPRKARHASICCAYVVMGMGLDMVCAIPRIAIMHLVLTLDVCNAGVR